MKSDVELVSFHSVSKGMVGECGRRGGYMELRNIDSSVHEQIYKLFSIGLCANTSGQIMVDLMVKPPVAGDPSYQLYTDEMTELKASLARRSKKLSAALNTMENISCTEINGAMYAFPTVQLPPKAVEAAKKAGMPADTFYAVSQSFGLCALVRAKV